MQHVSVNPLVLKNYFPDDNQFRRISDQFARSLPLTDKAYTGERFSLFMSSDLHALLQGRMVVFIGDSGMKCCEEFTVFIIWSIDWLIDCWLCRSFIRDFIDWLFDWLVDWFGVKNLVNDRNDQPNFGKRLRLHIASFFQWSGECTRISCIFVTRTLWLIRSTSKRRANCDLRVISSFWATNSRISHWETTQTTKKFACFLRKQSVAPSWMLPFR